jgi:hypothetical protein
MPFDNVKMLNFASLNQARDIKAVKLFANTYLAKPFVVIAIP